MLNKLFLVCLVCSRCTGYRPILEAFKKFAADNSDDNIPDIEELKLCHKSVKPCAGTCAEKSAVCHGTSVNQAFQWQSPASLQELLTILQGLSPDQSYRLYKSTQ